MSKLNDYGIIKLVKSNNSYVVDIDGVIKHISGDNLSIIQKVNNVIMDNNDNANSDIISINDENNVSIDEDNISDTKSIPDESEFEFTSSENNSNLNVCNARRRQYRSELEKLHVGFPLPASRTRSGRI